MRIKFEADQGFPHTLTLFALCVQNPVPASGYRHNQHNHFAHSFIWVWLPPKDKAKTQ